MLSNTPLKTPCLLACFMSCLLLAGCVSAPPSPETASSASKSAPLLSVGDPAAASVLRTGYRWAKAGASDQIVIPPERFIMTGVDEAPLDRDGRMLSLSSGVHLFDVTALGGPFRGAGQIKARLQAGADYQLTGYLDNRGSATFIVWLEDTLTHQPASARVRLTMSRTTSGN
jgi:ABC-type uncharacterized transport system auxiliary subunit